MFSVKSEESFWMKRRNIFDIQKKSPVTNFSPVPCPRGEKLQVNICSCSRLPVNNADPAQVRWVKTSQARSRHSGASGYSVTVDLRLWWWRGNVSLVVWDRAGEGSGGRMVEGRRKKMHVPVQQLVLTRATLKPYIQTHWLNNHFSTDATCGACKKTTTTSQ